MPRACDIHHLPSLLLSAPCYQPWLSFTIILQHQLCLCKQQHDKAQSRRRALTSREFCSGNLGEHKAGGLGAAERQQTTVTSRVWSPELCASPLQCPFLSSSLCSSSLAGCICGTEGKARDTGAEEEQHSRPGCSVSFSSQHPRWGFDWSQLTVLYKS